MATYYSNPNQLPGTVTAKTSDTLNTEVSITPTTFTSQTIEVEIPIANAANFAVGDTVTCMFRAPFVGLTKTP